MSGMKARLRLQYWAGSEDQALRFQGKSPKGSGFKISPVLVSLLLQTYQPEP